MNFDANAFRNYSYVYSEYAWLSQKSPIAFKLFMFLSAQATPFDNAIPLFSQGDIGKILKTSRKSINLSLSLLISEKFVFITDKHPKFGSAIIVNPYLVSKTPASRFLSQFYTVICHYDANTIKLYIDPITDGKIKRKSKQS